MRKYLLIMAVVFTAILGGSIQNVSAQVAPENYGAEYNATNFYVGDMILTYDFTGLQLSEQYSWLLQGLDDQGTPVQSFGWKASLGVANATPTWYGATDMRNPDGSQWVGAMRVIDSFGQVQGTHYALPGCTDTLSIECGFGGTDWMNNGAAVQPNGERFAVSAVPIYPALTALNGDGYFHPRESVNFVTSESGGKLFLHYRAGATTTSNDYVIYDMGSGAEMYRFALQDLIDYNTDVRNSALIPWHVTESFIIINTDGSVLPNINHVQDSAAFNRSTAGDNPHTASFVPGAYEYVLETFTAFHVADGESIFFISDRGSPEWNISTVQNSVGEAGNLRIELGSRTEEIFDDGYSDHSLTDSCQGLIDASDYAFQTRRADVVLVCGVAQDGVTLTWNIFPDFFSEVLTNVAFRDFSASATYNISTALALVDRVDATLAGFGMDTNLGRGLGMLVLMMVGFLFIAKNGARTIIPFGLVYLVVGGAWLSLGLGDTITTVLFGITAIFVIFIMVNSRKSEGSFSG